MPPNGIRRSRHVLESAWGASRDCHNERQVVVEKNGICWIVFALNAKVPCPTFIQTRESLSTCVVAKGISLSREGSTARALAQKLATLPLASYMLYNACWTQPYSVAIGMPTKHVCKDD